MFADLKALFAQHGITTYSVDGDLKIDRDGLAKAIELGLLPEDPADLEEHFRKMRDEA
jgi:flagellar capping protein FliD